jgi:DNA replication and repair protein RecF
MVLNSIELKNFRLHRNTQIGFSNKINYIVGGNGQGKTSLLEAIYYLCTTKSINQSSDSEAVTFLEDSFDISGNFYEYSKNNVRVSFDKLNNKKAVIVDRKQIHRASELIGRFPVVALLQTDHGITQGSPIERRRFVDSIISQASTTYLKLLLDYNKVLRNRSALLHKLKESVNSELYDQLDAWTESLLKLGTEIIEHRIKFVEEFNEFIQLPYEYIMGTVENPRIFYSTFFDKDGDIKDSFSKRLSEVRSDELRRARNLIGPHRDDIEFFIDKMELRKFGSQGKIKHFRLL